MSTSSGMDLKVQEYGTLKVPYEILNKRFRSAQKTIDREVHGLSGVLSEVEEHVATGNATNGSVVRMLDGVLEKLQNMKRKAGDAIELEVSSAKLCKLRIEHLKEHASPVPAVTNEWKKTRFNRMVVDHLLRCGFYNTAMKLAEECNIQHLVNADVFIQAWKVEQSLDDHEFESCLSWCHENRSRLRKLKSELEFKLHLQQFIELVRNNQRIQAVSHHSAGVDFPLLVLSDITTVCVTRRHARKHLCSAEGEQLAEVKQGMACLTGDDVIMTWQVMGLLAFNPKTHVTPYQMLFSDARWLQIKEQFRFDNYRLHQLGDVSIFKVTLQAGLAGLKTHQCYNPATKSSECPVCSTLFNKLAEPLPFAHCAQSRLICYITGKLMNEHNHPMMLPNGYVYGEKGLEQIARDGKVICPKTNQQFSSSSVEKLFVM